jgi:wyosine [tRNA(Phe)-imidazoG37] synthetase (radical SAM superfamily)
MENFTERNVIFSGLESRLQEIQKNGEPLDVLTFAGNGEPTLHPEFNAIIDDVILLRNRYFPDVQIAVLTNSTTITDHEVVNALKKVDLPILKLDSAVENTFRLLNKPADGLNFEKLIAGLRNFDHFKIIQTMFLKGEIDGRMVDNTSDFELNSLIEALQEICPDNIMIYSLDRVPPAKNLVKISQEEMLRIAKKIKDNNLPLVVTL